jgi:pimeloyl-ACP methyl ester carboxylesterase
MRRNVHAAKTLDRDAVIARKRAESPTWAEEEFGAWADAKARVSDQFMNALGRSPDTNWRSLLASIVIPVLLVTADPERGAIVTPEGAREAGSLLPTLRTIRLPGAGHNIRREQFDAFSSAVREFLATYARAGAPA